MNPGRGSAEEGGINALPEPNRPGAGSEATTFSRRCLAQVFLPDANLFAVSNRCPTSRGQDGILDVSAGERITVRKRPKVDILRQRHPPGNQGFPDS